MDHARLLQTTLALVLAGCAGTQSERAPALDRPHPEARLAARVIASPSIYVMRHLQKAEGADPALSAEGKADAERLVATLAADPPAAIFVSKTRRARETAAPLAAALGITPREYDPADPVALIAEVAKEPGPVLIVGHSNTVADLVGRLGGAAPPPLAETQFGDIWRIERAAGRTTHMQLGN